jgi:hypothetical protein
MNTKLALDALKTARVRFTNLALHDDSMRCGVVPSVGAKECDIAIAALEAVQVEPLSYEVVLDTLIAKKPLYATPQQAAAPEIERLTAELDENAQRFHEQLTALATENKILTAKNRASLANNLCSDHRDKQTFKPCLACEIDRLSAKCAELVSALERARGCIEELLHRTPVRDVTETLGEIDAALAKANQS